MPSAEHAASLYVRWIVCSETWCRYEVAVDSSLKTGVFVVLLWWLVLIGLHLVLDLWV